MKLVFSILLVLWVLPFQLFSQENEEVLLVIGDHQVTKSEFLRIYNKNNAPDNTFDNKSVEEYLELFINFKLKVLEAQSMGLDTLESFITEFSGYRDQLAKPYLTNPDAVEELVKEAYDRMKQEVSASHILVRVAKDASPADTLAAWNKISNARKRVLAGEDFTKVAKQASEDPSVEQNGGYLGYFSAFRMIYPFESGAYNTPVGDISMPIRTDFGYHLIKVLDKRASRGELKVAHIMAIVPQNSPEEEFEKAKTRILEIEKKINEGGDFAELAKEFSDDKNSGKNGGEMQWFGTGRMVPEFEEAAYALVNPGDVSKPVRTSYGWHIIKLLEKRDIVAFDEIKDEIKSRIGRDERANFGDVVFLNSLKKEFKLVENKQNLDLFYQAADSAVFTGEFSADKIKKPDATLFTFAGKVLTNKDFASYIRENGPKQRKGDASIVMAKLYETFLNKEILDHEDSLLETKYPEFGYLMKEYHDGILLFDITDKLVWSRAVKDTVGLEAFHEQNRNNYMWEQRLEATIYSVDSKELAEKVRKQALKKSRKKLTDEAFAAQFNDSTNLDRVKIEAGKFLKGDNSTIDSIEWTKGATAVFADGDRHVFVARHAVLSPTPKALNEARGLITADYQNYLEDKWIKELRNKYPVTVKKDVLAGIK